MPRPYYSGPPEAELRRLYLDEKLSTRQIAERFDVTHMAVKRWLRRFDIPRRPAKNSIAHRGLVEPTASDLQHMVHDEHLSYREIAERYGACFSSIGNWLAKHGIPAPSVWETRRRGKLPSMPSIDELRTRYEAGEPLAQIDDVGPGTLANLAKRHGIELRPDGFQGGRRWICADGHEVRSSYEQRVDDWLTERGIDHEVEPRLPFDRRFHGDFLARGVYVEVWGVVGSRVYEERKQRKIGLYQSHGLPLVELPVWSFYKGQVWRKRLAAALHITEPPSTSAAA